ncbi:MAG: uroporphyrinogen decarboxylase family protein [Candidatus Helarchaeota archaeon]
MDNIERIWKALNLEEPDRVPTHVIYLDANNVDKILGPPPKSDFEVIEQLKQDFPDNWLEQLNNVIIDMEVDIFTRMAQAVLEIGIDCVQVGFLTFQFINEHEMIDIFGRVIEALNNEGNIYPFYKHGSINSKEKWKERKEDIVNTQTKRYSRVAKKFYKKINKKFQDQTVVFVTNDIQGIWESAWQGFGMENFVRHLYTDKDLIKDVVETITDFTISCFMSYMDAGAKVFVESEDLAYKSGPMMSPKIFDELLVPCYKRLVEAVHSRDGKIILHSDGNLYPILDSIVDCGFDGLHSIEPTAGMDLGVVKKKYGDKLCLLGNIDVGAILTHGTKDDVFKAVKEAIKKGAPGGGYFLSPSNMINSIKVENLKWMVEAAKKYGQYPINL